MNASAAMEMEELYKKYWPVVLTRCRSMLGCAQRAENAAQEVFVKILEKRGALKLEYPSSLFWTMATNHCLDILKSHSRRAEAKDGDSLLEKFADSFDLEAEAANRDLLRKLFDRVPENSRAIAVLHFVDGLTAKDTALELGLSVRTVTYRLRALRETLKKLENV